MACWQRRGETRDPLDILLEREERTCKGCIHQSWLWGAAVCLKLEKLADKRCGRYKEKK